jgi:hypothetical protein
VQQIRGEQISCDLSIPKPPKGQTLDPNKVNVELSAGDEEGALSYNEECEDGVGWHYDDAKDPSYIELCDKTCDMVKSSDDATVNVVFGCETRTLEIR